MEDPGAGETTVLLRVWRAGDEDAYRQVCSMLYSELRRQAARRIRGTPAGDTFQTTSLVHETFMRLTTAHRVDRHDRKHFLAIAAQTMRRLLVELVRDAAAKRGAGAVHVPLDSAVAAGSAPVVDLIALDQALEPRGAGRAQSAGHRAEVLAGLTVKETAEVLDVSADTVARDWRMAQAWLLRELTTDGPRS